MTASGTSRERRTSSSDGSKPSATNLSPLPCSDLVHLDFHHRNVLRVDGALSGGGRLGGMRARRRAFDLVTFWFGMTHARSAPAVTARIWDRASKLAEPDALVAYFAHMALRRLDWTIRHYDKLGKWSACWTSSMTGGATSAELLRWPARNRSRCDAASLHAWLLSRGGSLRFWLGGRVGAPRAVVLGVAPAPVT